LGSDASQSNAREPESVATRSPARLKIRIVVPSGTFRKRITTAPEASTGFWAIRMGPVTAGVAVTVPVDVTVAVAVVDRVAVALGVAVGEPVAEQTGCVGVADGAIPPGVGVAVGLPAAAP